MVHWIRNSGISLPKCRWMEHTAKSLCRVALQFRYGEHLLHSITNMSLLWVCVLREWLGKRSILVHYFAYKFMMFCHFQWWEVMKFKSFLYKSRSFRCLYFTWIFILFFWQLTFTLFILTQIQLSKQARYFSCNAFEVNYGLFLFCTVCVFNIKTNLNLTGWDNNT